MKDTAVLSLVCSAGLRAAKEADYKIPLALKFTVAEVPEGKPLNKIRR